MMVAAVHYSNDQDGDTHGDRLGHARMPVILSTADYDRWLDPSFVDSQSIAFGSSLTRARFGGSLVA